MTTPFQPLLARNTTFSTTGSHEGLTPVPRHQAMIVTCMDGRVDPAHLLQLELGDALVMRNGGGPLTEDVVHEVAFIGAVTGMMFGDDAPPFEVAIVHHTGCGTGFLADPGFRSTLADITGATDDDLAAQAVVEPEHTVRVDVDRLRHHPARPARALVSGHVYDVDTGVITTIVPTAAD